MPVNHVLNGTFLTYEGKSATTPAITLMPKTPFTTTLCTIGLSCFHNPAVDGHHASHLRCCELIVLVSKFCQGFYVVDGKADTQYSVYSSNCTP
jgi:hypothetical protein